MSQKEVADQLAVPQSTYDRWEHGTEPPASMLPIIATVLHIDLHELTPTAPRGTFIVDEGPLSPEEGKLIRGFRRLPLQQRDAIILQVDTLAAAAKKQEQRAARITSLEGKRVERARMVSEEKEEEMVRVRLFFDVAAGKPIIAERGPDELDVPARLLGEDPEHMGTVRARGDSMTGVEITDGTLLLCRATMGGFNYQRGDVVIAWVGDDEGTAEMTVKTFIGTRSGIVTLAAENPDHPDIVEPATRVRIQGVVRYRLTTDGEWAEVPRQTIKGRR